MATPTFPTTRAGSLAGSSPQRPADQAPRRLDPTVELSQRLAVLDLVPDVGSWSWDPAREGLSASARFTDLLELAGDAPLTMEDALAAMPEEDAARVRDALERLLRGELESCRVDYRLRGAGSALHCFEGYCLAVRDDTGKTVNVMGAAKNVTARREAETAAALQGEMLDEVDAAVLMLDPQRSIIAWSDGAERLYGWCPEEVIGRSAPELLMSAEGSSEPVSGELLIGGSRWEGEQLHARKDGSLIQVYSRLRVLRDERGAATRVVAVCVDISERKEAQRELEAAHEYLRAVTDTMDESMFTLDAEGLVRYINPAAERLLGWSSGELLGKRMHELAHYRTSDGMPSPAEHCPILAAGRENRVVEITDDVFVRRDGTLLPVAYTALPLSTGAGGDGCVVIFEDITKRKAEESRIACDRDKLAWAARLREALVEERLELYSQPIVDCADGAVVQQELLLRLHDPELGIVTPNRFLPVAEELGLIGEVDRWVIRKAAEIAVEYGAVELNLSARSIADPDLVDYIGHAIQRAGTDPAQMLFEITETAVVSDEQAACNFVERLHRLGCKVALDDFGTGYGSFTYLKQLPIDMLKIDVEFVRDLAEDRSSRSVVEAVVSLAHSFGLTTVGEGVEDQETFELLAKLGVDHAQGYHLGRPRPLDEHSPRPRKPDGAAPAKTAVEVPRERMRGRSRAAILAAEAAQQRAAALRQSRRDERRPPP